MNMREKRTSPRITVEEDNIQIFCRDLDTQESYNLVLKDISRDGFGFYNKEGKEINDMHTFKIIVRIFPSAMGLAKIIWYIPSGKKGYAEGGMRFVEQEEWDRQNIDKYMESKERKLRLKMSDDGEKPARQSAFERFKESEGERDRTERGRPRFGR